MYKVYQYWHHRRLIVQKYGKLPAGEYEVLQKVYEEDDKNYLMWTYKMWLTECFDLWELERKDVVGKIKESHTNNSLWSYRYFLVFSKGDYTKVAKEEIQLAQDAILKAPTNESAWTFYKGVLLSAPKKAGSEGVKLAESLKEEAIKFSEEIMKTDGTNRFAGAMLIDLYKEKEESKAHAMGLCEKMAEVDLLRKNYWLWLKDKIKE